MQASHFILMIESNADQGEKLATQLVRLGVEPIRVADLAEAIASVKSKQYAFGAVILPSDLPGKLVHKAMKSMRRREPVLPAMAYGKVPDTAQAKRLRRAGVLLALWDGYDEGMLRFQLNRLVAGDGQSSMRKSRRAPTHTPVRVLVGGREKDGVLYSLSEGGCFIESPRASMDGARLTLLFDLAGQPLELDGVVAFANVPGNLQRPNLPLGMGVRWKDMDRGAQDQISQFVRDRMSALEV
jgi:hypothetical protein